MRVELERVGKRFGSVTALRDVDCVLPSGGRMALIGPNGAGKSTLTRIVMGMLSCTGEVRLDGRPSSTCRAELAPRIAYVPQIAPRLAAPVREVVGAVARLRQIDRSRIAGVAERLGLETAAIARRPFRALSGGMRQKLLLALALATDPDLLVLDEPTASLDARTRAVLFDLIARLPHEPTILLCSHRLVEIRHLVDRVLALEDGAVVYQGDAREYLRERGDGVVEVLVSAEQARSWLAARGFRLSPAGWWTHQVRNGDRMELLGEVVERIGDQLHDLVVRESEYLELNDEEARS